MRDRAVLLATALLALAGLVVSLTALWPRLDGGTPALPEPGPTPVAAGAPVTDPPRLSRVAGRAAGKALRQSPAQRRPTEPPRAVRLTVPSATLDAPLRPVGVSPDGQMTLPPDPRVLGWYRFGPAPGEGAGSVVVAGHLDSTRYGLGPLVGLREVEPGDPVAVTRTDGTRRGYVVVDVRRYDRGALPEELFARTGPERLRIITCGGEYLPEAGGYQQNLVVTAAPRAA